MVETGRPLNADVVKRLENLTINDLEGLISVGIGESIPILGPLFKLIGGEKPSRKEVLRWLKMIISGGDPTRLDPGGETQRAALLFAKSGRCKIDIQSGDIVKYLRDHWDKKRDEIAKSYGLEEGHVFSAVFETLRVETLATFRGLTSFSSLPALLPQLLPRLAATRRLNILYPGSAFHAAPLITAMKLIDSGIIDEAEFTYTEKERSYLSDLEYITRVCMEKGIFEQVVLDPFWKKFDDGGEERTLIITYKGHPIRIIFALNRSGEKYYRDDYFKRADLVIIHDPGHGFFEESVSLLSEMILQKTIESPQKDQVVIMEGVSNDSNYGPSNNPFPETMRQYEVGGPYGHCNGYNGVGEIKECKYSTARVFLMNDSALLEFVVGRKLDDVSASIYTPPPRVYMVK
ncbi:MAG: hypothetical protein A3I09_00570 [Deltaproteobacteria bacterium RIFCSPLOWO2_02_FULL_47_10]|nr:MAG: hypothetical protein A3I09_00570 [Deltaproteobacteria bacterium RIFCSPLOWO2_02_FULL_47_10]